MFRLGGTMPKSKLSENDTLIISGQEIQPFDEEDLQMDWINEV